METVDKRTEKIYKTLLELETEQAINLILDFHGTALLDDEFETFLEEEGIL